MASGLRRLRLNPPISLSEDDFREILDGSGLHDNTMDQGLSPAQVCGCVHAHVVCTGADADGVGWPCSSGQQCERSLASSWSATPRASSTGIPRACKVLFCTVFRLSLSIGLVFRVCYRSGSSALRLPSPPPHPHQRAQCWAFCLCFAVRVCIRARACAPIPQLVCEGTDMRWCSRVHRCGVQARTCISTPPSTSSRPWTSSRA